MTLLHRPWEDMKRCVLNADGSVNYFLNPSDSTQKATGGAADLTGGDGNVMVQIPKFYFRHTLVGDVNTWKLRTEPLSGYTLHPAFVKAGVEVDHRYVSAYDACVFDGSSYIGGLNLDSNTSRVDVTPTTGDKLASVSGQYPMVGLTRAQFRTIAGNNGTGWHQLDFSLYSAIQMLYLVEYADFNTQANLGDGNTNSSYLSSSADQDDSPHTIAGASNAFGNSATDGSQPSAGARPGTAFMSYRGIENWYGNCWNWADGINVNVDGTGNVHITNDYRDFADGTASGHELVTSAFPTSSGFIRNILNTGAYFLSSTNSGGSSTTFITDQHFASAAASRVVRVGGSADRDASAGGFCLRSSNGASSASRGIGARLCF